MNHLRRIVFILICITSCTALRAQWERIGPGDAHLNFTLEHGNYLYARDDDSIQYRSTDYGKTWHSLMKGIDENYFSHGKTIAAQNGEFISYVLEDHGHSPGSYQQGFYMMRHGDSTWRFYRDTLLFGQNLLRQFITYDSIFAITVDTPNHWIRTFMSTDAGNVWAEYQPISLGSSQFYKCIKFKSNFCVMGLRLLSDTTLYLKSYITKDFGKSWTIAKTGSFDTVDYLPYFDPLECKGDSGIGATISSVGTTIYTTTNGGVHWDRKICMPEGTPIFTLTQLSVIGDDVYLGTYTDSNSVYKFSTYRSHDWGSTWEKLPSGIGVYARTYNGYIVTGELWTDSLFGIRVPFRFSNIPFLNLNPVYADGKNLFAIKEAVTDTCFYSDDEGSSWKIIRLDSGLKMGNSEWVVGGKQLYTSGITDSLDKVILVSDDEGFHWHIFSNFGTSKIWLHTIFAAYNLIFVLAVHSNGDNTDYISTDRGQTWKDSNFVAGYIFKNLPVYVDGKIYFGVGVQHPDIDYMFSPGLGRNWEPHFFPGEYRGKKVTRLHSIENQLFVTFKTLDTISADHYKVSSRLCRFDTEKDTVIVPVDSGIGKNEGIDDSPIHYNDGVYYITSSPRESFSNQNGKCKLLYSLDSMKSWKEAPGTVPYATTNFVTKNYVYLSGGGSVWRLPKTALFGEPPKRTYPKTFDVFLFPNPASSDLSLIYSIPLTTDISVSIVDVTGRTLIHVLDGARFMPGIYTIPASISSLPFGMYFVRVRSGEATIVKKFLKF